MIRSLFWSRPKDRESWQQAHETKNALKGGIVVIIGSVQFCKFPNHFGYSSSTFHQSGFHYSESDSIYFSLKRTCGSVVTLESLVKRHVLPYSGKTHSFILPAKRARGSYDCHSFRVIPKSYSIRGSFASSLMLWLVELSDDGELWVKVNRRNRDLNGEYVTQKFKISHSPSQEIWHVRSSSKPRWRTCALFDCTGDPWNSLGRLT